MEIFIIVFLILLLIIGLFAALKLILDYKEIVDSIRDCLTSSDIACYQIDKRTGKTKLIFDNKIDGDKAKRYLDHVVDHLNG